MCIGVPAGSGPVVVLLHGIAEIIDLLVTTLEPFVPTLLLHRF